MEETFKPVILPEISMPPDAAGCMLCPLHQQRQRVVWAEGRSGAPLMVVLDNPGAREDAEGNAFVCGTRETLQRGLTDADIALGDILVTYILKCRPVRAYDKPFARQSCIPFLDRQLAEHKPKLVLCLGNVAVRAYFDDEEREVKAMRGMLHQARGVPIVVSYHPLAVRRRPNLYRLFVEDCRLAADMIAAE